jgi:nucleoside-diphosphate-sugar epimerase
MKVLIMGGAGMIGRKLAERLARDGTLAGKPVTSMVLHDVVAGAVPAGAGMPVEIMVGNVADPAEAPKLAGLKADVIFQLAAIVSGEAEQDFEKGYAINMDGGRHLLEALRAIGHRPRLVFASSIAVFGAPFPEAIGDEYFTTPLTSYGTQKAICELLVSDYTRKGFLDGIALRLPTICVRPGKPNKAASGFFSNIIREPLAGEAAVLPVSEDVRHWHASPRAAVGFMLHAASMDTGSLGNRRAVTLPGVSVTVGEQIEALRKVAGEKVVARIERKPDPFVAGIVAGWPRNFEARRARDLGFEADKSFEDIIRIHIADELGGKIA